MSDAERLLWKHLRAHRFAGEKFRRQEPIGTYIVDFVSHNSHLIIEVDGGQHTTQVAYDEARTLWLNSRGYRVIRFWNNQVLVETEAVLDAIALTLPHKGEGNGCDPPPQGGRGPDGGREAG